MKHLLLLNGPNLNRLGKREPDIYGAETLTDLETGLKKLTKSYGYGLDAYQSNDEGKLIDYIHEADGKYAGIILNAGAYTHTSIALRDAISAVSVPVIEVHISNVHERESFRHVSMIASVCRGQIVGFGFQGYKLAALAFMQEDKW